MKGRYIQLQGGKKTDAYMFDRKLLVEGYTNDGRYVPEGGVILGNGNLAGYVISQSGGNGDMSGISNNKSWTVIGKIDHNDPNLKYIPLHQNNNNVNKTSQPISNRKTKKNHVEKQVSLKTAVKMLREYYRNNFN